MLAGYGLFQLNGAQPAKVNVTKSSGNSLSAIPFTDLQGRKTILGDWQEPILVVNFWAPWCAPCRREIPTLIEIQKEYIQRVKVIGLALDSVENVQNFSVEHEMNYPSFIAGSNIPMYNAAFDNKSGSLPYTAILDHQRKLTYKHTGEITPTQLRQIINELL